MVLTPRLPHHNVISLLLEHNIIIINTTRQPTIYIDVDWTYTALNIHDIIWPPKLCCMWFMCCGKASSNISTVVLVLVTVDDGGAVGSGGDNVDVAAAAASSPPATPPPLLPPPSLPPSTQMLRRLRDALVFAMACHYDASSECAHVSINE